jgi:hypothetical protein
VFPCAFPLLLLVLALRVAPVGGLLLLVPAWAPWLLLCFLLFFCRAWCGAVLEFGLCGSRAFPFGFCTPCFFVFCCGSWALPGLLGCFRRCRMSSFCFCCVLFVVFVCFTPILPWVSLVDPPVCPQAVWGDVQCTHSGRAVHFGLCLSTCMVKCGLAAGRHVGQCAVYLALGRPVRLRAWKHPWAPT